MVQHYSSVYIDSHAHLTSPAVLGQLEELLARAREQGVGKIVNICTDAASLKEGLALAERCPWVFNTAATTPHDVLEEGESFFPEVEAVLDKLVAIGETGLDYHYEHAPREVQKKFLLRYFALAIRSKLPLVIHCREAFADLFAFADAEYKGFKAVLHCFTGTLEEAKQVLDRGWLISFSGIITFKKSQALREVVKYAPLDRILIETDTPFLAPQSKRGKQNEPSFLPETAAILAELKGVSLEEVAKATSASAEHFFLFENKLK